jgi:hypothetical protein
MTATDKDKSEFWQTFLRAVETEPRTATTMQGASGLTHPVVAIGVDERRRRVVVISGESDGRAAAMAHADIQVAIPSMQVVIARPIPVNLGHFARAVSEVAGGVTLGPDQWRTIHGKLHASGGEEIGTRIGEYLAGHGLMTLQFAALGFARVAKEIVQQLSLLELEVVPDTSAQKDIIKGGSAPPPVGLSKLIALDPAEVDRRVGVCSIPLYDLTPVEAETFARGVDVEQSREILRSHEILQYFFPAADQLTLAWVDGKPSSTDDVVGKLLRVPEFGHPFGQMELLKQGTEMVHMVDALHERGLVAEGEMGIELTPEGTAIRASVRYKPREGLLTRLSRIFSVKVDLNLKDLKG